MTGRTAFPSPRHVESLLAALRAALFPRHHGDGKSASACVGAFGRAFNAACRPVLTPVECRRAWSALRSELPAIRAMLDEDVLASVDGDPAATGIDEVILCYPGLRALCAYRVANAMHTLGIPLVPRMLAEAVHSRTGIDIHPGATIAPRCFIDHGTGVVIGESAVIGPRCTLYQGVTLGALRFEHDADGRVLRDARRHPTLREGVTVYANATILGGKTVVGAGSVIGADVFLTSSVPAGSRVFGDKPAPRSGAVTRRAR